METAVETPIKEDVLLTPILAIAILDKKKAKIEQPIAWYKIAIKKFLSLNGRPMRVWKVPLDRASIIARMVKNKPPQISIIYVTSDSV